MKNNIRDMWADALESGEYKKGTGYLRSGDKFCAFGVLCELAIKNNVISEPEFVKGDAGDDCYLYDHQACTPPQSVVDWAGTPKMVKILTMNDSGGNSFKSIAKYIRENL